VSAFLAVYVLGVNPKGAANRAFFVLMLAFVLWDVTEAVQRAMPASASPDAIEPWTRLTWVGISLVPAALMHLALTYPEPALGSRTRGVLALAYVPFLLWSAAVLATDGVIDGVSRNAFGPGAHVAPTYPIAAALYGAWLYSSVVLFVASWWRLRRRKAGYMPGVVALGLILGSLPAGITETFWPLLASTETRMGLGSLYTLAWSVFIAYAVARYHYLVIDPVIEVRLPRAEKHGLGRGLNYLVLEPGRTTAMGAFREIVSTTPGLCVSALPPSQIGKRFGLERTPILWITSSSSDDRSLRPSSLEFELLHAVVKFLRENPGTAILLDDLDYVAQMNGFDAVARFLRRVTNQASASGGTVLVAAGLGTFPPDQLSLLRGFVDHVLEILRAPAEVSVPDGDHVLLLVSAQESPGALLAAGARGGLLLTVEHPSKARRRYGDAYEIVWVTDADVDGPRVRPRSLDAEAKRTLVSFVSGHPGADVVIAGLEQLALFNDFRTVLGFVKDVLDLASLAGCRLFVTLAPESLPAHQVAMLARRFDAPLGPLGIRGPPPSGPTTGAPGSRILYRGPSS